MAFTHTLVSSFARSGESLSSSVQVTKEGELNVSVSVPAGQTVEVEMAISLLTLKSLYLHSDQALTLKTNFNGDGDPDPLPDDEIELAANQAVQWHEESPYPVPFDNDIATLFLTNGGESAAAFNLRGLVDPTP